MLDKIRETFNLDSRQLETYSPLTLAYIGDVVYELVIRTVLSESAEGSAKVHTKKASELAKAVTQAKMAKTLVGSASNESKKSDAESLCETFLTADEIAMYKRGRNANTTHGAKSASAGEYRSATGFEALVGWLFLKGEDDRLLEIIQEGWKRIKIKF